MPHPITITSDQFQLLQSNILETNTLLKQFLTQYSTTESKRVVKKKKTPLDIDIAAGKRDLKAGKYTTLKSESEIETFFAAL